MTAFREWRLDTQELGRRVLVYDATDSTSTRCAEHAGDPQQHGLAVLAHAQSAGRGQHGRQWQCTPGTGLLLSLLLFPRAELCRPAVLTAWAAVSVCKLIEAITGAQPYLKWPNDVLIDGRKVCGILIEQNRGVVAGIGLNLNQTREDFDAQHLPDAASLRLFTGDAYVVEQVARRLIETLDGEYRALTLAGPGRLEEDWRSRLHLLGATVQVESHHSSVTGRLHALSFDALLLEDEAGELLQLAPEHIQHISRMPL